MYVRSTVTDKSTVVHVGDAQKTTCGARLNPSAVRTADVPVKLKRPGENALLIRCRGCFSHG